MLFDWSTVVVGREVAVEVGGVEVTEVGARGRTIVGSVAGAGPAAGVACVVVGRGRIVIFGAGATAAAAAVLVALLDGAALGVGSGVQVGAEGGLIVAGARAGAVAVAGVVAGTVRELEVFAAVADFCVALEAGVEAGAAVGRDFLGGSCCVEVVVDAAKEEVVVAATADEGRVVVVILVVLVVVAVAAAVVVVVVGATQGGLAAGPVKALVGKVLTAAGEAEIGVGAGREVVAIVTGAEVGVVVPVVDTEGLAEVAAIERVAGELFCVGVEFVAEVEAGEGV